MSKTTERLIQVAAVMAICWFGWLFVSNTVLHILRLQNKVAQCEQMVNKQKG
ncbi:MAG: hypothetical protein ACE5IR_25355 [bacterium]